jgi:hypothetical protein
MPSTDGKLLLTQRLVISVRDHLRIPLFDTRVGVEIMIYAHVRAQAVVVTVGKSW